MKHILRVFLIPGFFILWCFLSSGLAKLDDSPYPWPELRYFPKMPRATENPVTTAGVELGRHLFHDPILSADSSFSCGSCHIQEFAFSDAPKQFSKGIYGKLMKRNTPPLFNLAWYPAMNWDGKHSSIETQVFHPVSDVDEMGFSWPEAEKRVRRSKFYPEMFKNAFGDSMIDSMRIAYAIAQFERSLLSHNAKYDRVIRGEEYFTEKEFNGFLLANDQTKGDCLHCHTTDANALGTTAKFSNNGLDGYSSASKYEDRGLGGISGKERDIGLFKIPSLRNVALTAPYMHDGRFSTLEEVIEFYSSGVNSGANVDPKMGFAHQGGAHLSTEEKEDILAFLLTLTDSSFISDPKFSNPFNTN